MRNLPKQNSSSSSQEWSTDDDDDYFKDEINENTDQFGGNSNILPTDVGSRIGIMYTVKVCSVVWLGVVVWCE